MSCRLNSLLASSRVICVCAATLVVTLAITVWGADLQRRLLPGNSAKVPLTAVLKQSTPQTTGPIQMIRFVVYDAGIHPREAKANRGRVAIMIEDLSGGTDGLRIERLNGTGKVPVGSVRRAEHRTRGRAEFELEPGEYQVTDLSRQANITKLIVEP